MTPDELRALADAFEPMASAPRFEDINVPEFCRWLRAQADAQPVAIVGEQRSGAWAGADTPAGYVWSPPSDSGTKMIFPLADLPLGTKLYARPAPAVPAIEERGPWFADRLDRNIWIESDDLTHDVRLYVNGDFKSDDQRFAYAQEIARRLNAAPAAPAGWKWVPVEPTQAMNNAGLSAVNQYGKRSVWETYAAMLAAAPAAPQAEPKREPLPGLAPTHRCPACGALWRQCDDASWNLRSASCCGLCDAGRVELVRLLDEPKREPLSDESITKGEYVLATKWSDGDPGDHWGVGFYDRLENGRHYIVDSSGKQIRGNGFRRVGRITAGVGRWLLSAAKSLEASPPGTINLWTMLTERAHGIGGSDAE